MKSRQFVDSTVMYARAGKGGNGSASLRREKYVPRGGPDGGDGGRGGHVILVGDEDVDSLVGIFFEPRRIAEDGINGSGRGKYGKNGADLAVPVPLGTVVKTAIQLRTRRNNTPRADAPGRTGGRAVRQTSISKDQTTRAIEFTPGTEGEEVKSELDLRVMADAGLVGFPSAASQRSRCNIDARPKIAAYHFTTLNP